MASETPDQDDVALDALLEEIYQRYHHDFRSYSRRAMCRGVARAQADLESPTVAHLQARISRDPAAFDKILRRLTIRTSDLFRDPAYYAALRESVVPHLATYPSLRIWVAGCAAGEEAYSLAILLHEEGLLDRALIHATDIDAEGLRIGESGTYELGRMQGFTENYLRAGGRASLSDYYATPHPHTAAFAERLRKHVLFSDHSLATDAAFAEVQLVTCRNVLIYFDRELQDRAIGLFRESLCPRGFLSLGWTETLSLSRHATAFEPFAACERIYRVRKPQ